MYFRIINNYNNLNTYYNNLNTYYKNLIILANVNLDSINSKLYMNRKLRT